MAKLEEEISLQKAKHEALLKEQEDKLKAAVNHQFVAPPPTTPARTPVATFTTKEPLTQQQTPSNTPVQNTFFHLSYFSILLSAAAQNQPYLLGAEKRQPKASDVRPQ